MHFHTCLQGLCAVLAAAAFSYADEPAVSISDFGVDKVMSGPVVSINDQYKGVVKIEVDSLTPDYATPWDTGRYQGGIGTGFLIGENAFMTNAHVVSNAERIYISMYGDSRKIPARVKFIAHDADLALLEADDPKPFKGIRPFEFSKNLPHLEDEVRVIGYPIGGNRLSVTRGVVSRIDFTTYAHPRNTEHLTIRRHQSGQQRGPRPDGGQSHRRSLPGPEQRQQHGLRDSHARHPPLSGGHQGRRL